ncbi:hypothetical protein [Lacimonas salitolerans]|uniref:Uncharacterized protein n=1 Tax=Lacimonas salitolerans TaxID=1323750 RepID=A0ABW4ED79_9RHOB
MQVSTVSADIGEYISDIIFGAPGIVSLYDPPARAKGASIHDF